MFCGIEWILNTSNMFLVWILLKNIYLATSWYYQKHLIQYVCDCDQFYSKPRIHAAVCKLKLTKYIVTWYDHVIEED